MNADLRLALRRIRLAPGFAAAAIVTLGVGIAIATALFAVVDAVAIRPLPLRDPDRLVWIWATHTDRDRAFLSIPDFRDVVARTHTLADIAAIAPWGVNLVDVAAGGPAERLTGARVSPTAFALLGARALHGRALAAGDDAPARRHVAVLGHGLWRRRFGGDAGAIGRAIVLDGESYTVVGVLPDTFALPNVDADIFAPLSLVDDPRVDQRGSNFLRVVARLAPGASRALAADDLAEVARQLAAEHPDTDAKMTAPRVIPLRDEIAGAYARGLPLLLAAVALLLGVACADFTGLALAHLGARRGELALRAALGATRFRLARQLFVENALLVAAAGAVGALLTPWGIRLVRAAAPADLPRAAEIGVGVATPAFAVAAALACAILVATGPAAAARRVAASAGAALGGTFGGVAPGGGRARAVLLVGQLVLSLVLVSAAGLLARGFARLAAVHPGFEPRGLAAVKLALPRARYATPETVAAFHRALADRLGDLPAVAEVAIASHLPLAGINARTDFTVVGRPPASTAEMPGAQWRFVGPGYFRVLGIPVVAGRAPTAADDARARRVVAIDRALARRFLPDVDPVGARLRIDDGVAAWDVDIVGVVGDVAHVSLADPPTPTLYFPIEQIPAPVAGAGAWTLVVRPRAQAAPDLAPALRAAISSVDATVAASPPVALDDALAASLAPRRLALALVAAFAGAALLLAAAGLAASVAANVSSRRREIGVRMALGGTAARVVAAIVAGALRLVVVGIVGGVVATAALARLVPAWLAGTDGADPVPVAAAAALVLAVSAVAAWLPARRAARIDPMVALRAG